MPEWHQLDSSITMPEQQESTEKKTLKSSSRSLWFSTGLLAYNMEMCDHYKRLNLCFHNNFHRFVNVFDYTSVQDAPYVKFILFIPLNMI